MGILGILLIIIGSIGILKKSYIVILISLELVIIGILVLLIKSSIELDEIQGLLYIIYILAIGATETAIGLALIIKK